MRFSSDLAYLAFARLWVGVWACGGGGGQFWLRKDGSNENGGMYMEGREGRGLIFSMAVKGGGWEENWTKDTMDRKGSKRT